MSEKILGDTLLPYNEISKIFDDARGTRALLDGLGCGDESKLDTNKQLLISQDTHTRKEIAKVIKLKRDELNQGFQHDETSKKECLFRYAEFLNQLIKELEG